MPFSHENGRFKRHSSLISFITESPGIFEPAQIGGISIRNRFIRSATDEGMGNADEAPLESLEKLYVRLARGGVGAILTGYAGVTSGTRGGVDFEL
jgi:2,4-dienoyl-CoA reductase-like NADH-dependent reductase (Old Yellow Enzyme family)